MNFDKSIIKILKLTFHKFKIIDNEYQFNQEQNCNQNKLVSILSIYYAEPRGLVTTIILLRVKELQEKKFLFCDGIVATRTQL